MLMNLWHYNLGKIYTSRHLVPTSLIYNSQVSENQVRIYKRVVPIKDRYVRVNL